MNRQEIVEACRLSKEFFAETYYKVAVPNKGVQPFVMKPHQQQISAAIDEYHLNIGLKARQIGWTTIGVFEAMHSVLFHENRPWLFISRNEKAAQKMVKKASYAYYRLPKWMRAELPKLVGETQSELIFSNDSYIESVPATGDTGRGDSVYGAILDECAFMEYAEDIWGAVEPLIYGPAMLFSTANGMGNFFHEIWLDSQRPDSAWHGIFYPWQTGDGVVEARDSDWYDFKRLTFRGREWLFYQEYPSSPEEAFAKSGRVAFSTDLLADCYEEIEPAAQYEWVIGEGAKEVEFMADADIPLTIWRQPEVVRDESERPVWEPNYVVGCDVAEGLEHGDFSYVSVFDVNTGEQVASSKSSIPVSYLDELLAWLGNYYLQALIIVERNNAGILPLDRLYRDRWYPRLYRMDKFGQFQTSDRTPKYGWRTDPATKPKMVNDFIYALSEGNVILHDPDFLLEAQTFVANGKGGYGATSVNHDDAIMGTLTNWQGILDSHKYPILWRDETTLPPTHEDLDNLFFPTPTQASDILEKPLGQPEVEKPKKSVVFTEANIRT